MDIICQCNSKLKLPEDLNKLLKDSRGLWGVCPNPDCGLVIHMKFNGQNRCKDIIYHRQFPLEVISKRKKKLFVKLEIIEEES